MTAFLTREQEFVKINEQLDKMTKMACEKPSQSSKVTESKFATFTKKGPIAVVRQNTKIDDVSVKEKTSTSTTTNTKENVTLNLARKKFLPKERPLQGIVEEKKNIFERNAAAATPRSSGRAIPVTRSSTSKNPSNVVLRYKNNSFIQSPSLEFLVREENESIRSLSTSYGSDMSGTVSTARAKVNLSSDGIVKYLKSRIVILQTEHDKLTQEMSEQKEVVEKSVERQKKVEAQRDIAYTRNNALMEQVAKLEAQLEDLQRRLKDKDSDQNGVRKELEAAKRELKVMAQTNANLEKRLFRANEELENIRNVMNQMKNSEKEARESIRNENDVREKQIKGLKKQRADLLNAYKKQLFLIDNLKRQNLCMEQSRMIAFGEKEFTKVLDWQTNA